MTSKMIHRRAVLTGVAALGGLSLLPRRAHANQWPTRPVKLVVPFAAGGTTDILARVVAAKVSEEFGQQFVVENKTGAGGNIAAEFVAKAEPDGYTFVVGTPGTHAINQFVFKNMNYDQAKDIAPVIIIARVPIFARSPIRCR
jgi:tripartite-type tricarboxylate transporter receptor subunit TctC